MAVELRILFCACASSSKEETTHTTSERATKGASERVVAVTIHFPCNTAAAIARQHISQGRFIDVLWACY